MSIYVINELVTVDFVKYIARSGHIINKKKFKKNLKNWHIFFIQDSFFINYVIF